MPIIKRRRARSQSLRRYEVSFDRRDIAARPNAAIWSAKLSLMFGLTRRLSGASMAVLTFAKARASFHSRKDAPGKQSAPNYGVGYGDQKSAAATSERLANAVGVTGGKLSTV